MFNVVYLTIQIQIVRENKTMNFIIDSIPQEKLNLTKKLSLGSTMYVGGVPEKDIQLPDSLVCSIKMSLNPSRLFSIILTFYFLERSGI